MASRKMKITMLYTFCILFSMPFYAQTERKYIRQGNGKYENEKYDEAEVLYRKALEKNVKSDKADYNLANTLYKQKKYEAAATKYESLSATGAKDKETSDYYYNLGNSYFKDKKLEQSIEAYKNALKANPSDMDAKHNLLLAKMMQQQQQQQQQQKQQQNKDKNQQQQQQKAQGISKEDAERLLEALQYDEQKVMKKVQEEKAAKKVPVDKNW